MEKVFPKQKYYENVANTIIQKLGKRQIEGYYCKNMESALKKALELIPNRIKIILIGEELGYKKIIQEQFLIHNLYLYQRK